MLLAVLVVTGCGGANLPQGEAKYPTGMERTTNDGNDIYSETPSIFGRDGLIFGKSSNEDAQTGIGVNSFLWRASLDTVAFMPLASADPFGGVILTDWYSPPETPNERFKINVFILDKQLRSDGIQVKVFRQVGKGNNWRDSDVGADTARQLEDAILTRARQMRVASMGGNR
ncbi:MAG: DUF3576 domain-containing protein, partial [Alphaproteobacteria bacterium]|nr:DUF3576 domain-containing protein [Alphaproteobacteria bacterium]